jgi:glycosyltransferase involved in cell wall biosynthesis
LPFSRARLFWGIRQALGALVRERATTNRLIHFSARLSSWPERIVYNSERARIDHETIGYSTHNGLVIANGFDTEALRPDGDARSRLRKQLQLSEDTILIGHMARYHPVKDHATFLKAASALSGRGSRFYFLMTGRGVDTSNAELVSAVERLDLTQRVALLGEADDVRTILPGLDMLCVSSRSEAFPNVIGEAMSCGIACVTTDVGDAALIVGETGQVVAPGKPNELADALYALAQLHPDERVRRGLAARQRIIEKYSLRSMIDRYLHLYSGSLRRD